MSSNANLKPTKEKPYYGQYKYIEDSKTYVHDDGRMYSIDNYSMKLIPINKDINLPEDVKPITVNKEEWEIITVPDIDAKIKESTRFHLKNEEDEDLNEALINKYIDYQTNDIQLTKKINDLETINEEKTQNINKDQVESLIKLFVDTFTQEFDVEGKPFKLSKKEKEQYYENKNKMLERINVLKNKVNITGELKEQFNLTEETIKNYYDINQKEKKSKRKKVKSTGGRKSRKSKKSRKSRKSRKSKKSRKAKK